MTTPALTRLRCAALLCAALALCLGALAAAARPALANPAQISIMMDDDQLVYAPDSVQRATLFRMATLGVNWVRATVLWSDVAKGTRDPRTHRRFDPSNPRDYPHGNFADYDRLVRDAAQYGITVYFNITGPGPSWAMGKTKIKALEKAWMPDAAQFGKFVAAVGTRYSGTYPNGAGKPGNLPAVKAWSIWNEPNWPTWLAPQSVYDKRLRAEIPYAPMLYRRLYYAARRSLDATGHAADFVMIGETQPLGSPPTDEHTALLPAQFVRELFCVDGRLRSYHGLAATERGCGDFSKHKPFRVSAFAHHPYTKTAPPTHVDRHRDAITLGNIQALPTLLDRIASRTHRLAGGLPIMVTEMGYSSNPPNPFRGVSLDTQAAYINESDYLAYKQPRVYSMTQFLFKDSAPVKTAPKGSRAYWATFQTGLTFLDGTPKPAYAAYALPIWVRPGTDSAGTSHLELWAQVRFRRNADPRDALVFQYQAPGAQTWTNIAGPLPIAGTEGFVDTTVPAAPYASGGKVRAAWSGPVPPSVAYSRQVTLP